jgi:L-lactate dehydrogenase (cytochrome)
MPPTARYVQPRARQVGGRHDRRYTPASGDHLTARRFPRWADVRPFLQLEPMRGSGVERRLARAASIEDLRRAARRHAPRAVFDYVDGGAEQELSLRRSRAAFASVEFLPRVLRDVTEASPATTILGRPSAMPLVFAPTGFTRLMHHEGEPAVARAATRAGIPYSLGTVGTTSPEQLATSDPGGNHWFQLYVWRDRGISQALVERARAAGFGTLVLTVDTPVGGARLRDLRSGFTIPPSLRLGTLAEIAMHPGWWFNLLTTEPLRFATPPGFHGTAADLMDRAFNPSLTLDDVDWLRGLWPGSLVVKGLQDPADALAVVGRGADAVVVSNHGGRQLDRVVTPLEQLQPVLDAVGGRAEVFMDGGVMSGADVIAAVAMGARSCLVGRAYLYGLMAGGERGVDRAAAILRQEMIRTMKLLGVSSIDQLTPEHARLRGRPGKTSPSRLRRS